MSAYDPKRTLRGEPAQFGQHCCLNVVSRVPSVRKDWYVSDPQHSAANDFNLALSGVAHVVIESNSPAT